MEYLHLAIKVTTKEQFTKTCLLWQRRYVGMGCGGHIPGECASDPLHYIHAPRLPYRCKFDESEAQMASCVDFMSMEVDPGKGQYRSLGPHNLYTGCVIYGNVCRMRNYFPPYCESNCGELTSGMPRHPIWWSSGSPELEDLPKYTPVEVEKPKLSWWKKLWKCEKEEEIEEYCGEPISLTPEDVEAEVNHQKCVYSKKAFIHPLVDRIGCDPPSFKPEDMPGAYLPKHLLGNEDENPRPLSKKSWFGNILSKEPKMEIAHPPIIPQAKVVTFEELCESIKNMIMTPARFDCTTRDADMFFQDIPLPFYSRACNPEYYSDSTSRTLVSPVLRKPTKNPSPFPTTPSSSLKNRGQSSPQNCPPTKIVCDGKTPINEMPPPFYSECPDQDPKPSPHYSDCKEELSTCFPGLPTEKEKGPRNQCKPYFSQCNPHLHPANQQIKK